VAASATKGGLVAILVSALILDAGRVLLCGDGGDRQLPTVALDGAEEMEEALARLLRDQLALNRWSEEFLDTFYESAGGARSIRNVYSVHCDSVDRLTEHAAAAHEFAWAAIEELDQLLADEDLRAAIRGAAGLTPASSLAGAVPVTIITGPPGAGKSTVADLLCRRLERAAVVELDQLQHMVRSGYASPIPGLANPIDAAAQRDLVLVNAAALARNFALAGFHVIIEGVIESAGALDLLLDGLAGLDEIHFVTLLPNESALAQRDQSRPVEARMGPRSLDVRRILEANGERRGLRLDTSRLSAEETALQILQAGAQSRVM